MNMSATAFRAQQRWRRRFAATIDGGKKNCRVIRGDIDQVFRSRARIIRVSAATTSVNKDITAEREEK